MILLFASTDVKSDELTIEWHNVLMRKFFADLPLCHRMAISGHTFVADDHNDYCAWYGITCNSNEVYHIQYVHIVVGNLRIHDLPPTINELWISACRQKANLKTRCFPRELLTLSLSVNKYFGTLGLSHLPRKLQRVCLRCNALSGPIILIDLPPQLVVLEVHGNKITQSVVWYSNLPKKIETIQLQNEGQRKIGKVCGDRAVNPVVFNCIDPKYVE